MSWFEHVPWQALTAFMSMIATAFAAFATWKGPTAAARIAETLRQKNDRDNEKLRMKLNVFATIMQERATIYSLDSVRMLNSIDFVFDDSPIVRESWAELYHLLNSANGNVHPQLRDEKLKNLLKSMADNCGLSGSLDSDDLGRVYYPNYIAAGHEIEELRQRQQLEKLRSQTRPTETAEEFSKRFPPPPPA